MRGLRKGKAICLRKMWKRFEGIVQLATIQFVSRNCFTTKCSSSGGQQSSSSSDNDKKRSMRADECSGPYKNIFTYYLHVYQQ